MIPYELLITSAGRAELLQPTLQYLLRQADQLPTIVRIHDDARGTDPQVNLVRLQQVKHAVLQAVEPYPGLQVQLHHASPGRRLGLALNWLLHQVQTDYVLYSQDDHVAVRPLPITLALRTMAAHTLHHVRFNKRATMAFKQTWRGVWQKAQVNLILDESLNVPLTLSDHWYFQTSLWRVAEIRKALAFWTHPHRVERFSLEEPEGLINYYFDHVAYGGDPENHHVRRACQRTFIWGPIGEDRYIRHIGGDPDMWAGDHLRTGGVDDQAKAWREIYSYPTARPPQSASGRSGQS